MKMIERGLAEVHADLLGSHGETPGNTPSTSNSQLANGHVGNGHVANGHVSNGYGASGHLENGVRRSNGDSVVSREPFAVVTMVTDGSPADLAVSAVLSY